MKTSLLIYFARFASKSACGDGRLQTAHFSCTEVLLSRHHGFFGGTRAEVRRFESCRVSERN